jgi:vesicle coat complex subunit
MLQWYDFFEPPIKSWEATQRTDRLVDSLSNRDPEMRCLAYDALGRLRIKDLVPAILAQVAQESDATVRARAAVALGRIGAGQAIIKLCDLLSDEAFEVRAAAVRALRTQSEKELLSVYCALLDDENDEVIVEAVHALGQLGDHRAITPLHQLLERSTRPLKDLASTAINAISLQTPMSQPVDEVYFFTYSRQQQLFCECYSYKLVAWRNHLRRRWHHPFARDWGMGFCELPTLSEHITAAVLPAGFTLTLRDYRA